MLSIVDKYKKRYILFLTTIILTIIVSQIIIQYDINKQVGDARYINEAGRQRMLSQRISKLVLYLKQDIDHFGKASTDHLDSLKALIHRWEKVHYNLLNSVQQEGINDDMNREIDSLLHANTLPLQLMVRACRVVLDDPTEDAVKNAIEIISQNELKFLMTMERTVNAFQNESEEKLKLLKKIELLLAGLAIIILTIEFIWLFIPIVKKLRNSNQALQSANAELANFNQELESNKTELSNNLDEIQALHKQLEYSEKKFRQMIELADDMIFELNTEGKFVYLNPASQKMLKKIGLENQAIKIWDILHPDRRKEAKEFITAQIKSGNQNCYVEYPLVETNGLLWVGLNVQINYADNIPDKVKIIARDITAAKETQRYLQLAKERAEQLTLAKARFLSTMSHEIRTPMNAIIGLSNLLLEERPKPEQQENIRLIKFSSEHLLGIVNDILDVSKIESGKIELEKEDFNLKTLCDRLVKSLAITARGKKLSINLIIDDQVEDIVYGDSLRLTQVLNNLLGNAIKFTDQGEVNLKISKKKDEANKILFEIHDTGIGIPKDKLHLIFESFTQATKNTQRKYGGTGLGLSISKKLIEIMGGEITVKSEVDVGTAFTFFIELPPGKLSLEGLSKYAEPNVTKNERPLINKHILIVEDNSVNQIVAKKYLEKWGAAFSIASHGLEALDLIKSKKFDLILMDLQMPIMDGYEASRIIRAMEEDYFKSIPIIALTAEISSEISHAAIEAGMNDIITKPFKPEELKEKIVSYCNKSINKDQRNALTAALNTYTENDPGFKIELTGLLIKNIKELEESFEKAVNADDVEELKKVSHKVKATLEIIGAQELYEISKKIYENPTSAIFSEPDKQTKIDTFRSLCKKWVSALELQQ